MRVFVNDEPREVPEHLTLAELLIELKAHPRLTAVVQNGKIMPREELATREVRPDDRLEVVTLVGGG